MGTSLSAPANPDGFRLAECGMIGAVAQWCEGLHGQAPLLRSLQLLANGIDAEAVALVRYARSGVADGQPIAWERSAPESGGLPVKGFARSLLGGYFAGARPGSLWFRSMMDEVAPDLVEFQAVRHLRELAGVPLDVNDRFIDTLEIHLADGPRNYQHMLLNSLAPVLSHTWKNRARGLFTEAALQRAAPRREVMSSAPVLSSENPARLSRAEYRVGLMLSRGMTVEEVKASLNIQDSTLRTHLSNLYAKTKSSNLTELVFQLVATAAPQPRQADGPARFA